MITLTDLLAAATLPPRTIDNAKDAARSRKYKSIAMGTDWGGGGIEQISWTVFANGGITYENKIEVFFGERSLTPHDKIGEAKRGLYLGGITNSQFFAHDYNGAGAIREQFWMQAGVPTERIIPCWYTPAASGNLMRFVDETDIHPRAHYKIDKARAIALVCEAIKKGYVTFFADDYAGDDDAGLLRDFLALAEEQSASRAGRGPWTPCNS
jgi:hypothetical protein